MVSWHVRDKFTVLQWPPQSPHVMDAVHSSAVTLVRVDVTSSQSPEPR